MSSYAEVVVLVEGPTEQRFVKQLLAPYMAAQNVFLTPVILSKPGEKGGDVNSDIDMADVKPLEQKNHAVSLDTTKHTVSTGFPHVPFFSDS